jgi:hypothetical protein
MGRSGAHDGDGERENAWLCLQQAIADLTRLSEKWKENGYVESEPADGDPGLHQRVPHANCALQGSRGQSKVIGRNRGAAGCPPPGKRALPAGVLDLYFLPGTWSVHEELLIWESPVVSGADDFLPTA